MRGRKRPVRGGAPAARVGVVDEVVVDEGGGMEDLQRSRGRDDLSGRGRRYASGALHCPPPGDAEPSAKSFSAVKSGRSGLDEKTRFGAEIGGCGSLRREEVVQTLGNRFNGIRGG
jgi:hypothetical protein